MRAASPNLRVAPAGEGVSQTSMWERLGEAGWGKWGKWGQIGYRDSRNGIAFSQR